MSRYATVGSIQTPSQRWARQHNACYVGRRRLGRRSIGEYWNAPDASPYDLIFVARALIAEQKGMVSMPLQVLVNRVDGGVTNGRWALKHTRAMLADLFESFGVVIPAALL
jgi:hypothetical protein